MVNLGTTKKINQSFPGRGDDKILGWRSSRGVARRDCVGRRVGGGEGARGMRNRIVCGRLIYQYLLKSNNLSLYFATVSFLFLPNTVETYCYYVQAVSESLAGKRNFWKCNYEP